MPMQLIHSYTNLLLDKNSTLQNRREILLNFQKKSNCSTTDSQKIEFYDELKSTSNETESCYDYRKDWEYFKKIMEENE